MMDAGLEMTIHIKPKFWSIQNILNVHRPATTVSQATPRLAGSYGNSELRQYITQHQVQGSDRRAVQHQAPAASWARNFKKGKLTSLPAQTPGSKS